MKPDFFERLRETIDNFGFGSSLSYIDEQSWMASGKRLRPEVIDHLKKIDDVFAYGVAIRPVELEANMLDTKWNPSSRFAYRYLFLPTVPIGNKDERGIQSIITCGFIIMPRQLWYAINGFNEQYDVGCYWWDNEMFDRLIVNKIHIILDQRLLIFRHPHVSACLPENPQCKEIYVENQSKFPRVSPNDFKLSDLHEEFMKKKQQYIL